MRLLPFIMTLAVLAPAAAAIAQPADLAAIRQAEQAFETAQTSGDAAALARLLAPDFLFVRASGRIGDKRDYLEGFGGHHFDPLPISDPLLIRPSADSAIVGGETWLRGVGADKAVVQHYRFANSFARRNGQWVVVYSQITALPVR